MHKIPIGVLGASGYAGKELCALISGHPNFELAFATANERSGEVLRVAGRSIRLQATESAPLGEAALVFSSLPHGHSAVWVARAREAGAKVVDLSSDLRPGHTSERVPYGLTERFRAEVAGARVVANPGCYPTAVLLGLYPLLERGLVVPGATVTVDAASGTTGAGSSPRVDLLFSEVADDFRAYAAGNNHRHLPEMRAFVSGVGSDIDLLFTPHLLPVPRGILATMTVPVVEEIAEPLRLWESSYEGEPFVEVADALPTLKDVVHRNVVRITVVRVQGIRRPTLLVFAAIDNLVKGAAGQALQNANLMLGVAETAGLPA